eukprot:3257998-Alexandrium_andersonii.AAC.1
MPYTSAHRVLRSAVGALNSRRRQEAAAVGRSLVAERRAEAQAGHARPRQCKVSSRTCRTGRRQAGCDTSHRRK